MYACDTSADKLTDISNILLALPDRIGPMADLKPTLDANLRTAFKEIGEKKVAFYKELGKDVRRVVR